MSINGFVFRLPIIEVVDLRPFRPGIVRLAGVGRPCENFELNKTFTSMPQGCSNAVGACIAAADDDNLLAFGGDKRVFECPVALCVAVLAVEQTLRCCRAKTPPRNGCP